MFGRAAIRLGIGPHSSSFFFLLSSFFPRLISAAVDWMSAILPHNSVALVRIQDAGLKRAAHGSLQIQDAKSPHLGTIAQICQAISSQLRYVSTIGKKTC